MTVNYLHLDTAVMTILMRSGRGVMTAAVVAAMTVTVLFCYNFVSARWIHFTCAQGHFSLWRLENHPAYHKLDPRGKRGVHSYTFLLLQVSILNAAAHCYPELSV